jgi:hypothetical protein
VIGGTGGLLDRRAGQHVEAFGPVRTLIGQDGLEHAGALAALGKDSLVVLRPTGGDRPCDPGAPDLQAQSRQARSPRPDRP